MGSRAATGPRAPSAAPLALPALAVLLLSLCPCAPVAASPPPSGAAGEDYAPARVGVAPDVFIVELKGDPLILGGEASSLAQERRDFLGAVQRKGIRHRVRRSFSGLVNAVAVKLTDPGAVATLSALPCVAKVYRVRVRRLAARHVRVAPLLSGAAGTVLPPIAEVSVKNKPEHNVTGVIQVWETLGITGKGVKVGVIDSGIDYTHPAFGACSHIGKDCRVAYGYDFVGDEYNADVANSTPVPDDDPMDCEGHGTHVAGIVGGRDSQIVGVAPDVVFGAYRIFGCKGTAADDVILGAAERAWRDGMDVINLSLGAVFNWAEGDILSKGLDRLTAKGVVVVASMGNSGPGLWTGGTPGLGNSVIGVASFENVQLRSSGVIVADPGSTDIPFFMNRLQTSLVQNGTLVVSSNDTSTLTDGCAPYTGTPFAGKIALIRRGTCFFVTKAQNAQAAGAIAMVVYNREPGPLANSLSDPSVTIPVAFISKEEGELLVNQALTVEVQVGWTLRQVLIQNPIGGQVSGFSSRGPSPTLSIKPDIGAIGGGVYSSVPAALGTYDVYSGTSMASPYVAGVAALYLAANKGKNRKVLARRMKRVLQNSAIPGDLAGADAPIPVAYQGAGMVNALNALRSKTAVAPASLPLGFAGLSNSTIYKVITVQNTGASGATYNITFTSAVSVYAGDVFNPTPDPTTPGAAVTISPAAVTVPAGSSVPVVVAFTLDAPQAEDELWIYSGYLQLVRADTTSPDYPPVHVPYQVVRGTASTFQVIPDAGSSRAPYMMSYAEANSQNPTKYSLQSETATFTFNMASKDVPQFRYFLLRPARLVAVKLYTFNKGKFVGYIDYIEYFQDNTEYTSSPWLAPRLLPAVRKDPVKRPNDYTLVPNGAYYAILQVVKGTYILPSSQRTEVWRSPKIVIDFNE